MPTVFIAMDKIGRSGAGFASEVRLIFGVYQGSKRIEKSCNAKTLVAADHTLRYIKYTPGDVIPTPRNV